MANYNTVDEAHTASHHANSVVTYGSVATTAALSTGDKVRPCKVAGGTWVHRVTIKAPDLDTGTTLQGKIGFAPLDGSAQASGDDTAVAAAGAWAQSAATTVYDIFPPYYVAVDSWLQVEVTANGAANTGTVYGKTEGDGWGVK